MKLAKNLPPGSGKIIAERAGVSTKTVERVNFGKSQNPKVLKAMSEFLQERQQAFSVIKELGN